MKPSKFRGVIYEKAKVSTPGGEAHAYLVAGLLISEVPIEGVQGRTEVVVDGSGYSLLQACHAFPKFAPARRLGSIEEVLESLEYIVGDPLN